MAFIKELYIQLWLNTPTKDQNGPKARLNGTGIPAGASGQAGAGVPKPKAGMGEKPVSTTPIFLRVKPVLETENASALILRNTGGGLSLLNEGERGRRLLDIMKNLWARP